MSPLCTYPSGSGVILLFMAMTAATYKTKWESVQANGVSAAGTSVAWGGGAEKAAAYAQISAIWAYLYIEKSRMEKEGLWISPQATTYQNDVENRLATAQAKIQQPPVAVSWSLLASNLAYAFVEQVRVDNQKVAVA